MLENIHTEYFEEAHKILKGIRVLWAHPYVKKEIREMKTKWNHNEYCVLPPAVILQSILEWEQAGKNLNKEEKKKLKDAYDDAKVIKKRMETNFGDMDRFIQVCKQLKAEDCKNYQSENKGGVWKFVKRAGKFGVLAFKSAKCIIDVFTVDKIKDSDSDEDKEKKKAIVNLAKKAFSAGKVAMVILKQAGGFLAHFLSAGIWGAIKCVYFIIKVTHFLFEMHKKISDFLDDLPYNLGKAIGMAVIALKSLLTGRRRRR